MRRVKSLLSGMRATVSAKVVANSVNAWGEKKRPSNGAELDLKALNPDADGDGHVTEQEKEIYAALKAADIDGTGSIGLVELYAVIGNLVGEKKKVKGLTKLVVGLILLLGLALAGIFAVSIMAGELIKESKVNGGAMTTPDGTSAVQVDTVESTTTIWDIPAVETASLARMKDLVFYADMTADARFGGWVEATYKVGGVMKASNTVATIVTTTGETVTIRRAAAGLGAGELRMNGVDYPISDTCTGTCSVGRRKLSTDAEVKEPVVFHGPRKGRKLGFFSALMTSGSFMMMQAGAF